MWPAVGLHGSRVRINFPLGSGPVQEFVAVDPRMVSRHEVLENLETFEQIEEGLANEAYMADL